MEATKYRKLKSGAQYLHLFPAAKGDLQVVRRDASVEDTISFIRSTVGTTLSQTKNIAGVLKGRDTYETCKNIWHFVYAHIAYRKDKEGYEQIRSPARSWADRRQGVDCDCYSTFISSILTNLRIKHILRITKYGKDYFQHIYPIVPHGNRYIIIDCVTEKFDYEVPYTEKKDHTMDLQYLNGLEAAPLSSSEDLVFSGLEGDDEFGELGLFGRKKRKAAKAAAAAAADPMKSPDAVPGSGVGEKKGFFKKALNVINKINPATLLLRNGVLAAMKLNIGKIASRLRWSYLSPNQAKGKGMDMAQYLKLVQTRQKLEKIFHGAGGNPTNMKNAILRGKGNKDKAVNGLLGLDDLPLESGITEMSIHTPLSQLLGPEIYHDENVRGMDGFEGFGELGEPVTLATVAAASSVIAAIAASLKKIGDVFKGKKTQGSEDFTEEAANAGEQDADSLKTAAPPATVNNAAAAEAAAAFTADSSSPSTASSGSSGFWQKNKGWLLPAVIGTGIVTLGVVTWKMNKSPSRSSPRTLNGTAYRQKRRQPRRTKKKMVAII